MCGIVGYWRPEGLEAHARANLGAMMDLLEHRGPDGRGQHLDPQTGLAMGHTRLTIIDLHTGDQPLSTADGKVLLTSNSEFYDFKAIRARLCCEGERFATKTDAEIALALYRRHGLDFVEHLRGEFAFALWDAVEQRLVLVRDRFGVKPLYIHQTERAVYWGSEVKAVLRHPEVPRRLDHRAALHQLMQTMVPGSTAFEGIEAVRPGHMLIFRRGGDGRLERDERIYWDVNFPSAKERSGHGGSQEWITGTRDRLVDAVRVRLEADVPVGCYLSGGIDSCSILGMATAMQQSPVKAYTISFDDDAYDESSIAAEMARATGAEQEVLHLRARELYGGYFSRVVWHAERTFYNTLSVAKWHMSRRVRESGYKTVITGEGSDELFTGYPFFKKDLFLHGARELGEHSAGFDELRTKMQASNKVFEGAILAEQQTEHAAWNELVGFTPSWIQPWMLTLAQARPLLAPALREELADYDPLAEIAARIDPAQLEGRHLLDRVQYTWIKTMLEGQILTWGGDRVDMANSMESRPAFLDHHVAEFARMIPPEYRVHGATEKWVLREAMRGILPKVLYEREKFAFMAPPSNTDPIKRAAVDSLIERHASRDALAEAGIFDVDRTTALFERSAKTSADDRASGVREDILINHVLGLQILHQEFVAQVPRVPAAP
ncbi:asparagine synthase (glutamine-hydrolyzing) [Pseudenhygromyxa sp. WMMC2535]|uniref:asparagine synthase (glutamine-hydrolyzing) n=1 Tax=Pseudenhygromyxa sp. WMMC2535 TaxID=2712867 RepID=UPI001555B25E|nr:asparagine synthase (glutamine-hydrolyzing) [Pseudenhygromyxa sp. WMMC2535]NVB41041.1 asparagine synthase (glutamine-hydrolyzing) [Pseudenhygromyxa sp. WMMC2535]